jgi:hypothetical protein
MTNKLLLLALVLPACADSSPEPVEAPSQTLAASADSTSTLGVVAWDVTAGDGDQARIVGRDSSGGLVVDALAVHVGDRVRIESAGRTFELADNGSLDTDDALATALYTDLAHDTRIVDRARADDGLGEISQGVSLWQFGQFQIGWSMFGSSGNVPVGSACIGQTRNDANSYAYTTYGIAYCSLNWASPEPSNCAARVAFSIPGFHWDLCNWYISVN